jgi:hypothetical protein
VAAGDGRAMGEGSAKLLFLMPSKDPSAQPPDLRPAAQTAGQPASGKILLLGLPKLPPGKSVSRRSPLLQNPRKHIHDPPRY